MQALSLAVHRPERRTGGPVYAAVWAVAERGTLTSVTTTCLARPGAEAPKSVPADRPDGPGEHPDPAPDEAGPADPGAEPDPAAEPPGRHPDPDPDEL
jgi:hypothetical protein